MLEIQTNLVTIDSKSKLRLVEICLYNNDSYYTISRVTSTYGGKETTQPELIIDKGKAKRTLQEQALLEYNSRVKKYIDKGYKEYSPDDYTTEEDLRTLVGDIKTNAKGLLIPMKAKPFNQVNLKVFDKTYYASRKINGVRCLIYKDEEGIKTASRGSMNYDITAQHILTHPTIINIFNNYPDIILDGELYKHGWDLNKISGVTRTINNRNPEADDIEFYWYDIAILDVPFKERLKTMLKIKQEFNIDFNPYRKWENECKIQFVPQVLISTWDKIKELHDDYVKEGWEGVVIRNIDKPYGPDKRTNDMIKIKSYKDGEYKITGIAEGLRDEDMCFTMETPMGYIFKAKPMGDREQKQWYREHIDELIGKMGTVKYFEMSGAGTDIPQQPTFIAVRYDLE